MSPVARAQRQPPARDASSGGRRAAKQSARQPKLVQRSSLPGKRLPAQVIQVLGRRVVDGTYPEGEALPNEALLCEELGVSRTALREGLKVLGAKGLLVARPRIGTRVLPRSQWQMLDADVLAWRCELPPDEVFISQLAEMREIIEPAAASLAAKNRSEADLAVIDAAFSRMKKARSQADWVSADLAFHQALLQATGNALLIPLVALIGSALESVLVLGAAQAHKVARDFKVALPEHACVLEAIRGADAAAAHQAMSLLLSDTRRRLLPQASDAPAPGAMRATKRRR
ncbi:MAG TPA: FadR/GntR family transcriptional regulator [Burkholderiaceae bacterium]|nr:FadR/GntR family transcriptional regulator [Burkholderiaceae bacterium]